MITINTILCIINGVGVVVAVVINYVVLLIILIVVRVERLRHELQMLRINILFVVVLQAIH